MSRSVAASRRARAGSSMTAEIGIQRISEQIDALYTMRIDPLGFLVSPRQIQFIENDQLGSIAERRFIEGQFTINGVQSSQRAVRIDTVRVDQVHQYAGPFDMLQESVTQTGP